MVSGVVFNKFTPHNYLYSGTSDSGHSEEWTTSLQWTTCVPPANNCMHVRTSEEGTTSEKWTKHSSPTCPLFGGSTVYHPPPYVPLSLMSENTHTIIFLHFQHHTPQHTDTPYSTSTHTESYDFLPPSEPFFEKTTDSFCTSDIAHTHIRRIRNTHIPLLLHCHPLTQNPMTSYLLPSQSLKRRQTSQSVLIFYWSREMATSTQRPSLCCSLLPRITRSMLLRTRLKSLFWIQTVSGLCMFHRTCFVYACCLFARCMNLYIITRHYYLSD